MLEVLLASLDRFGLLRLGRDLSRLDARVCRLVLRLLGQLRGFLVGVRNRRRVDLVRAHHLAGNPLRVQPVGRVFRDGQQLRQELRGLVARNEDG